MEIVDLLFHALTLHTLEVFVILVEVSQFQSSQGNLKGESGLFFHPCVNAMGSGHISGHVWIRDIFGFDTIMWRDLHTLLLLRYSPRNNH